jgi:hypothetical protein
MSKPELLVDILYRLTYAKPVDPQLRDPNLRRLLADARRCVLTDDMAELLYSMMLAIYGFDPRPGDMAEDRKPSKRKRIHGRLDDCRWFSRLPHRVTWVEYSLHAMLTREVAVRAKSGDDPYTNAQEDLIATKSSEVRVGWLMYQHNKVDVAFAAEYFIGVPETADHTDGVIRFPVSIVWCTDDTPLPWMNLVDINDEAVVAAIAAERGLARDEVILDSASAFVTGVRGYDRSNVGLRHLNIPRDPEMSETVFTNLSGRARMMWAFLSIFNKVPILGERRVVPTKGYMAGRDYRKFFEHKVITVNIPEKAALRKVARDALSIIRRRAHLVRGHWRDDWHLPKGNKSLWIGEHSRGDASLGYVLHDYNVDTSNERA